MPHSWNEHVQILVTCHSIDVTLHCLRGCRDVCRINASRASQHAVFFLFDDTLVVLRNGRISPLVDESVWKITFISSPLRVSTSFMPPSSMASSTSLLPSNALEETRSSVAYAVP